MRWVSRPPIYASFSSPGSSFCPSSYLCTRSKLLLSNQPALSPNRLSHFLRPWQRRLYSRCLSSTCQLQTITAINGLPSPGPPVADRGEEEEEEGRERVQQQFAFKGLVSIISRGGELEMRSECMQHCWWWSEWVFFFNLNFMVINLSINLSLNLCLSLSLLSIGEFFLTVVTTPSQTRPVLR